MMLLLEKSLECLQNIQKIKNELRVLAFQYFKSELDYLQHRFNEYVDLHIVELFDFFDIHKSPEPSVLVLW